MVVKRRIILNPYCNSYIKNQFYLNLQNINQPTFDITPTLPQRTNNGKINTDKQLPPIPIQIPVSVPQTPPLPPLPKTIPKKIEISNGHVINKDISKQKEIVVEHQLTPPPTPVRNNVQEIKTIDTITITSTTPTTPTPTTTSTTTAAATISTDIKVEEEIKSQSVEENNTVPADGDTKSVLNPPIKVNAKRKGVISEKQDKETKEIKIDVFEKDEA